MSSAPVFQCILLRQRAQRELGTSLLPHLDVVGCINLLQSIDLMVEARSQQLACKQSSSKQASASVALVEAGMLHGLQDEACVADVCCRDAQTAKKLRGCFVYTSSAAAAIPSPFSVLYAATKSFLSSFGASLAIETKHLGIDVLVFHPSPVSSRSVLLCVHWHWFVSLCHPS